MFLSGHLVTVAARGNDTLVSLLLPYLDPEANRIELCINILARGNKSACVRSLAIIYIDWIDEFAEEQLDEETRVEGDEYGRKVFELGWFVVRNMSASIGREEELEERTRQKVGELRGKWEPYRAAIISNKTVSASITSNASGAALAPGIESYAPAMNAYGDYEVVQKLGAGAFGTVEKVQRRRDGMILARKKAAISPTSTRPQPDQLDSAPQVDAVGGRTLSHPNIIKGEWVCDAEERLFLVLELATGGDLTGWVRRERRKKCSSSAHSLRRPSKSCISAFESARGKASPTSTTTSNPTTLVLLAALDNVKLGDFGLAARVERNKKHGGGGGTPSYMSPEHAYGTPSDHQADIWSLGCVLFFVCTGEPAFPCGAPSTGEEVVARLQALPAGYSQRLRATIASLLAFERGQRSSARALATDENLVAVLSIGDGGCRSLFPSVNTIRYLTLSRHANPALRLGNGRGSLTASSLTNLTRNGDSVYVKNAKWFAGEVDEGFRAWNEDKLGEDARHSAVV
ncbi:kinase-like domain-containing protein [Catenaria anguillulae PL171]|uniref:non-specific serine/threonine protein kinase n=1 Tax=Catenaria anguillulae PL171 TaxID=765915 RepID=A0A1Y2I0S0_9FUNG|nr:kinase-like domain-containing protein [Catenaria anguillulae PL171]